MYKQHHLSKWKSYNYIEYDTLEQLCELQYGGCSVNRENKVFSYNFLFPAIFIWLTSSNIQYRLLYMHVEGLRKATKLEIGYVTICNFDESGENSITENRFYLVICLD